MLGLYPNEQAAAFDAIANAPAASAPSPSVMAGSLTAPVTGIADAALKTAAPIVQESGADFGQAMSPNPDFITQPPVEERTQDQIDTDHRNAVQQVIKSFQPDPLTTGFAGQTIHGVVSGGARLVGGSLLGGPVAGAALVGGTEGFNTSQDLQTQGVDATTAAAAGAGTALFAGAGAFIPGGFGSTLGTRIATGAASQEAMGLANRAAMHSVLDSAGYTAQAQQYKVLDTQAMLSDAILGAAFGGIHHVVAPSTIDAALSTRDSIHVEQSAPGVPVDAVSRTNNVDNLTAAASSLMDETPPDAIKPVETVPNPAQDALQERASAGVEEAAAEAVGEPVATPSVPDERRADGQDQLRMAELRAKRLDEGLTPAEKDEYTTLLEKDRLAAKVGGRRLGNLLNGTAYEEMLQRSEQLPVQGSLDMDMLKPINDTLGHGVGNDAIRMMGETLGHYFGDGNAFHVSGDEFHVQAPDQATYDAAIAKARQHLENHTFSAINPATGEVIGTRKLGFSHGSGKDIADAERGLKADKAARKAAGLRSDRPPDGRSVDAQPSAGDTVQGDTTAGAETVSLDDVRAGALEGLRQEIGWEQKGGRLMRDPLRPNAGALGDVSGRTSWEPKMRADGNGESDFWPTYRAKEAGNALNEKQALAALDKAKAGEKLSLREQRFVDYANETANRYTKEYAEAQAAHDAENQHATREATKDSILSDLDEATRQDVEAAHSSLANVGDFKVMGEDGIERPAGEALKAALADVAGAKDEGMLHQVAAACFGRA